MAKTAINRKKAAKEFADFWKNKGDERQETARFWIALLEKVLGMENPAERIEFEKKVQLKHTSFIDAYIPETKVLIEQKSSDVDLRKEAKQSDGAMLTPYRQAKRYADEMPNSLRPDWIVVCNFQEFLIYDMEKPHDEPVQVLLEDLPNKYECLQFMIDAKKTSVSPEEQISLKAGELVGKLYDALIKEYINPDENSFRSLNILCVRIVFCLYAEDAGLFETRTSFEDYIKSFNLPDLRDGILKLFKALDTKPENRDKYDTKINSFPYVNGGLFADDTIEVPNFNKEIVDVLVNHCAPFDWSQISPTIFGAVFESTLNPETRRKGGMHYTSIENIHKVIDPLFLDDLRKEFSLIVEPFPETAHKTKTTIPSKETYQVTSLRKRRELEQFRNKIASLKFLDPACGSGNFLTETYISLRRLENEILKKIHGNQQLLGSDFSPIKVKISQFYGIEINDFAVTVAKTALWIAESQMMRETEEIVDEDLDFLPLSTSATIVEGNALRMDWATLKSDEAINRFYKIFAGFEPESDGIEHHYDYIMGNPPFVGGKMMSATQKEDMVRVFGNKWKNLGNMDYVCCWYKKAVDLEKETKTHCAFVSTNSVSQGQAVAALWKPLFEEGLKIDFAWQTFRWDSESTQKAHVHCVIVGFSCRHARGSRAENRAVEPTAHRQIFNADGTVIEAKNINGYLLDAPDIFIDNRTKPLCDVPEMTFGSMPNDGGNFILSEKEKEELLKKEPILDKFVRRFIGAQEFINGKERYCLWLKNASPAEIKNSQELYRRVQNVRKIRMESSAAPTREKAKTPHLFFYDAQPENGNYLLIPRVSSENRKYIPIGFISSDIIGSDASLLVPNATLYHFGILTSSIHMAWVRAVCGRLKSDYRYSNAVVYNNFPWPDVETSPETSHKRKTVANAKETCQVTSLRNKVEQTAQAILDARAKYPDSSLADLYDETTMPPDLRKAHKENDKAVMQLYGFDPKMSESEIVAELFRMYERLTKKK